MTIDDFCKTHGACGEGVAWAKKECQTMEDVWQKAKDREPMWFVWVATRPNVLNDNDLTKLVTALEKKLTLPMNINAGCPLEEKVWLLCWQILKDEVVGIKDADSWTATWGRVWRSISTYIMKNFNPTF